MSIQRGISDVAKDFIFLYYRELIYKAEEVYRFYDENAYIWRDSSDNFARPFKEMQNKLIPQMTPGTTVQVSNYTILPCGVSFNVNVFGTYTSDGNQKNFVQSFVLTSRLGHYYILSDSLSFPDFIPPESYTVQSPFIKKRTSGAQAKSSQKKAGHTKK